MNQYLSKNGIEITKYVGQTEFIPVFPKLGDLPTAKLNSNGNITLSVNSDAEGTLWIVIVKGV